MSIQVESDVREMPAVVKTGRGAENVLLQRVPRPRASPGTALVFVEMTGICGTDLHIAHDEYGHEAPVVMGHEILGTVEEVGDERDARWVGTRVVCETYYSACERCEWCRDGRRNLCPDRRSLGSYENGGFASIVRIPVINLHRLPDGLEPRDGVLAEPLACVTHCLMDPPMIDAGDTVLVTGPGAMGQLAAQVARAMGGEVLLAGLPSDAERLVVAEDLGFHTTTDTPDPDRFDVVIECSGSAPGAAVALRAVKRGGRYVQVGIFGTDVSVPLDLVLFKEISVSSGFASTPVSWARAITLMERGLVTLGPLITREAPILDWASAFAAVAGGEGIKTVILPNG